MLKYFFYLYFQYEVEKDEIGGSVTSTFPLGYFSKKVNAIRRIACYNDIEGFKDYSIDCFKIKRQGVKFDDLFVNKSKTYLYELSHEYEKDGYDYYTIFGVFPSQEDAEKEMSKQERKKPYKEYLDGFLISKLMVDDDDLAWKFGFNKWE